MTMSDLKKNLYNNNAKELNELVYKQFQFLSTHRQIPKVLILGEDTAVECYGDVGLDLESFMIQSHKVTIQLVEGDIAYLIGELPREDKL